MSATDRTLIILRHAKSDYPPGVPDHQRPLNGRGRRDAPAAGRWLAESGHRIDRAVVSTAERTRQTWALAAEQLGESVPTGFDERIYLASWGQLLQVVAECPEEVATLVLVGHNPGCEDLAAGLAGPGSESGLLARMEVKYPTSAIAVLSLNDPWSQLRPAGAALRNFVVPRG